MIESPVLQELKAEWTRDARRLTIVDFLVARFGVGAGELGATLEAIDDEARLKELVRLAALCPDLEAFRSELAS